MLLNFFKFRVKLINFEGMSKKQYTTFEFRN